MSKQSIRKPLSIAIGAAVVSTLGATGIANASQTDENIFSMQELSSGYLFAGAHETKEEGEGSCGEDKKKDEGEGSCGEDKEGGEGKCGEGKCGDDA
jgi:uncharacterized low-complexity protein